MAAIPLDLLDRIRELERQVRALMGSANTRPAQNEVLGGPVRIGDGGTLDVREPGGHQILGVGFWPGTQPPEYGFAISRRSGKAAVTLRNGTDDKKEQPFRIYDPYGAEIVADDIDTGGLARPYLPVPMWPAFEGGWEQWPRTNSSSFQALWHGRIYRQQPKITLLVRASTDNSDTKGAVQLFIGSDPVGSAENIGFGVGWTTLGPFALPGGHMDQLDISLSAKRTAGTGSIRATVVAAWTRQS
ncbi:hypothetical protein AB0K09_08175 [Streptomyces sp. NPDC049577]|uniref:hypothetical protein n=1 Tax=Streptomyces sp. NPDC049577 TaxID=3155153 RepID=UPI00342D65A4